jgi:hypothetical protein
MMFEIKEITEIIAERRLYLEGQPDIKIRVILGKPLRMTRSSHNAFVLCPYQIIGIGDEKVRSASGIDEVQALQLAMEMIGSELYFKLNRNCGGNLRWEAGKNGNLGFPVPAGLEDEKTRTF